MFFISSQDTSTLQPGWCRLSKAPALISLLCCVACCWVQATMPTVLVDTLWRKCVSSTSPSRNVPYWLHMLRWVTYSNLATRPVHCPPVPLNWYICFHFMFKLQYVISLHPSLIAQLHHSCGFLAGLCVSGKGYWAEAAGEEVLSETTTGPSQWLWAASGGTQTGWCTGYPPEETAGGRETSRGMEATPETLSEKQMNCQCIVLFWAQCICLWLSLCYVPKERERLPPDPLLGLRVHCWVLILSGNREVPENFFINPLTGKSLSTTNKCFLGIESIWNHQNYWVNMQDCRFGCAVSNALLSVTMWFVLYACTTCIISCSQN